MGGYAYLQMGPHIGDENTGLPIMPRELSFCPTVRSWREAISDGKIILYSDPSTCSTVTVGMRREKVSGSDVWYPDYISFSLEIIDNELREKLGLLSRLITSNIVVWNEK